MLRHKMVTGFLWRWQALWYAYHPLLLIMRGLLAEDKFPTVHGHCIASLE
jgi:hypothetical protein